MLSRTATSLWLLGRQLERSDHLARILGVHVRLSLDRATEPGSGFWTGFMTLAGWADSDVDRGSQAVELVVAGSAGPSVRLSVAAARSAAQVVRPTLPSEVYEHLNALYWRVQEVDWQRDLDDFLADVQMSIRLLDGLLEDTMAHDEARDFVRLGKFLERASNVVSVVIRKSGQLAETPEDTLEWTAVLKACFGYESYRSRVSGPVTPPGVIAFLLLDPDLPRSARFSIAQALGSVHRIDGPRARSRPGRQLGRLNALIQATEPARLAAAPAEFESAFRALLQQLEASLRETYFHPSRVASAVPGDASGRVPQQQQQ